MKINRENLLEKLGMALTGATNKETELAGTNQFYFTGNTVVTFSETVAVHVTIEKKASFTGAVNAHKFFNILKKVESEGVSLVRKDSHLVLTYTNSAGGTGKVQLPFEETSPAFNYVAALFKNDEDAALYELPDNFIDAVKQVDIKKNESDCTGVFVSPSCVFSTNKFVISKSVFNGAFSIDSDIRIMPSEVALILKIKDKLTHYYVKGNWLRLLTKDRVCYSIQTTFYKTDQIQRCVTDNTTGKSTNLEFSNGIIDAVERAVQFAPDGAYKERYISVCIDGTALALKANNNHESFNEVVFIPENEGVSLSFSMNGDSLLYVLKKKVKCRYLEKSDKTITLVFENDEFMWVASIWKTSE